MKSRIEIYALSVCFASVICTVISSAILSYSVITVTVPEVTMYYTQYQSNDDYWQREGCCDNSGEYKKRPSEGELTRRRNEEYARALSDEKRGGLQALIKSLMYFLSGFIALLIHWFIAKRARS